MIEPHASEDGYKYFYFGTLSKPTIDDTWVTAWSDQGYRRMHRLKYPRAMEVYSSLQALEGQEVILRTRVTGDYEFDPSRIYFSDVYPADELAAGWPRDGDPATLQTIVDLRLTLRSRDAQIERNEQRQERYRLRIEKELSEKEAQLTKAEELYKKDVWNSRLERLLAYDANLLDELPENAWLMTLDEVMDYLQDNDLDQYWDDPMDEYVEIDNVQGMMPSDEELMRFEYEIKDMAISDVRQRSATDPEFERMMNARKLRKSYPKYDDFLETVAVMTDDQYWDAYGTSGEFADTNWHWKVFANGDTGWEDQDGYLWIGSNKGIPAALGIYRFPTRDGNFKRRIRSKLEMLQNLPMRICANDSNEFIDVDFAGDGVEELEPLTHFRHMAYTGQLQQRITAGTRHYIESYTESQAKNFNLEQQFDQLSPAEKQQLEDDKTFYLTNGKDLIGRTETVVILGAASSSDKKAKHPDKLIAINYGIDTTRMTRIEVTFKKQHHMEDNANVFYVELPQWGDRAAILCLGLNTTVKGQIGSIIVRSCWASGDQEAWKKFLAKAGVKKRAKEYDEPIEWFLDKYKKAAAIRDGF